MKPSKSFLLVSIVCSASVVFGQNLLANPSFEAGTPSANWQMWKADSATTAMGVLTFPDTGAPDGTRFARVQVTSLPAENWQLQLQLPTEWMTDSGATYELKFMAKSDSSSSIHVGIQDGPANNYEYRSGRDFMLSTEWTEQSLIYQSDRTGNGALRFNLYLGGRLDTYSFDAFSLIKQPEPVSARDGKGLRASAFKFRHASGGLVFGLETASSDTWQVELLDSRGIRHSAATGHSSRSLTLPQPRESGVYLARAISGSQSWTQRLFIFPSPQ